MKLCFPVKSNQGLQSFIFGHFGLAPLLLVVDTENQAIVELDNRCCCQHQGTERLAKLLAEWQFDALVVQALGPGALQSLLAAGRKVYQAQGDTIADNLLCLASNRLHEFTMGDNHMQEHGKGFGRGRNFDQGQEDQEQGPDFGQERGFGRRQNRGQNRGIGQRRQNRCHGQGCGLGHQPRG